MTTDDRKRDLIEEAWWTAMEAGQLPRPRGDGTGRQLFEAGFNAALAVFEAAQEPTTDEQEAVESINRALARYMPGAATEKALRDAAVLARRAILHRPVSPEPHARQAIYDGNEHEYDDQKGADRG